MNNTYATHYLFPILFLWATDASIHAGVEEALQAWSSSSVDTSAQSTPKYKEGYDLGYKMGNAMTKDEAMTYLKPWVYFRGTQENQKNCTFDATFNSVIESIHKNFTQSAITGKLKGQMGDTIERKIQDAAAGTKSYIGEKTSQATEYVKEKAQAAGSATTSYLKERAQAASSAAATLKTGISNRLSNAWKWLTGGE